ncbi:MULTISPECIES: alpha/beta fold hydrolase [unclassified Kitasatospora]|uniref:alpha/beta fold hydrolase n=1 Tax=unclassified Kitasatospora TaxID=2633591 RepID=UPI00070BF22D|nr:MULTISPECIES: alpha/beta hydrolase [unclassified Kitasatospora]KQV11748.1 alpha/beta hydrolase [Kitasatospora sp. Root107]KRB76670.1 alpha/beta hydrolase [Kitasatospora sp. Root187]
MSSGPAQYEELTVPVPGGDLTVLRWPATDPGAPTVVALHGITANALAWSEVARCLAGRATLIAPDLRGRAASRTVTGPYGLARHADDVAALVAALDLGPVRLTGHSMGAWIAALATVRHPELASSLLLVDGAVSFPLPVGVTEDAALAAVLGPALARLSMTFPSRDAYRAFWQQHPSFAGTWTAELETYIQRDLVGTEPELRSSCVPEAIRQDGGEVLLDKDAAGAVHRLPLPAELLWAERGLMDEPQGLYDVERIALAGLDLERVRATLVPDTNHYTIVAGPVGAEQIVLRLLAG